MPPQGARRRSNQSHWISSPGRMLDLDRQAAPDPLTRLAVGPQGMGPHAAHERGVAARVAERDDLVVEGREPEVRVVTEAGPQVRDERLDGIGRAATSDTRAAFAADIGADRLAVALEMAGDGRDRPAPLVQCVDLHVFSPCEHRAGLLRCCGLTPSASPGPLALSGWTCSEPGPGAQG